MHWSQIWFSGAGGAGVLACLNYLFGPWAKARRQRADEDRRMKDAILGRPEVRDRSGNLESPGQPGLVAICQDLQQEWPKNGTRAHVKQERIAQKQQEMEALFRNHISNADMTHSAMWAVLLGKGERNDTTGN